MATHRGRGSRRRRSEHRARSTKPAPQTQQSAELVAVLEQRREARETRTELTVSGSTSLTRGARDAKWDAAAAQKAVREWAGADEKPNAKYATAFFLKRNDGENFDDYGLGFAEPVEGKLQANWGGITAVAGVLSGARGGVKGASDSDIAGIKTKVEKYYASARKQYGDDGIEVPWADDSAASVASRVSGRGRLDTDSPREGAARTSARAEDRGRGVDVLDRGHRGELRSPGTGDDSEMVRARLAGESAEGEVVDVAAGVSAGVDGNDGAGSSSADVAVLGREEAAGGTGAVDAESTDSGGSDQHADSAGGAGAGLAADDGVESARIALAAQRLAYAQLGPDADESLLEMATALWQNELAPAAAITAAVGDVAWAPEDGFRDLICDVNEALSSLVSSGQFDYGEGTEIGGYPRAVDAAIKLDKVLICIGDDYFVAPITVGADNEPVLSDTAEWVPVEQGMIEVAPESDETAAVDGITRLVFAADPDSVEATLPEAHQPGSRMPTRHPSPRTPAAPASSVAPEGPTTWSAILAPEGKLTSDRRAFAPGSITWRELPLTLMAMIETSEGGHVGAQVAGRVDDIWRDEVAGLIRGKGVFDGNEYGAMIAGMVGDETLRGNSVDLAIGDYVTGPRSDWFDDDGNWIGVLGDDGTWQPANGGSAVGQSILDVYNEDTIAVVMSAEIGMTTVCPFPAFAEAKIAIGDSLVAGANPAFWTVTQQGGWTVETCDECTETIIASASAEAGVTAEDLRRYNEESSDVLTAAAAGLVPETPPAEWFEDPGFTEPTAITVDADGRISGHAAAWGVCHIGFPSVCRTAPHSKTDYAFFHLGEIVLEDGSRIPCGQITLDAPHADLRLDRTAATSHYDHTGTVVAHVRCGEDEHGIWVAGALQPDAPAEKVRLLRGSKLSGDWRDGELVALLAVNVPGFPVPRQRALAACGDDGGDTVLALVAAGIPVFESELSDEELERFAELRELAEAS